MKGWVLTENGKVIGNTNNSIEIFKTKKTLYDCFEGALGEQNSIKRVEYAIGLKQRKKTGKWFNNFAKIINNHEKIER